MFFFTKLDLPKKSTMKFKFILLVFILTINSSCKKYSQHKLEQFAINTWTLDKFFLNGKDETLKYVEFFNVITEEKGESRLGTHGTGVYEYSEDGTWKFSTDKKNLIFSFKARKPNNS